MTGRLHRRKGSRKQFWALIAAACVALGTAAAVTTATWPRAINRGVIPRLPVPLGFSPVPSVPSITGSGLIAAATPHGSVGPGWAGPLVSGPIRPQRLVIPSVGVDAPVTAQAVSNEGSLGVPDDPSTLGWWAAGPEPGSAQGTAVIDGHVDSAVYGLGALFRLRNVLPGQQLAVTGIAGSEVFTIDAVRQISKSALSSADVFDQKIGGRLVIVTCGGEFNSTTHSYRDNMVVYATPAPGEPTNG